MSKKYYALTDEQVAFIQQAIVNEAKLNLMTTAGQLTELQLEFSRYDNPFPQTDRLCEEAKANAARPRTQLELPSLHRRA